MTNSQPRVQLCRQIPHGGNTALNKLPRGMGMLKIVWAIEPYPLEYIKCSLILSNPYFSLCGYFIIRTHCLKIHNHYLVSSTTSPAINKDHSPYAFKNWNCCFCWQYFPQTFNSDVKRFQHPCARFHLKDHWMKSLYMKKKKKQKPPQIFGVCSQWNTLASLRFIVHTWLNLQQEFCVGEETLWMIHIRNNVMLESVRKRERFALCSLQY